MPQSKAQRIKEAIAEARGSKIDSQLKTNSKNQKSLYSFVNKKSQGEKSETDIEKEREKSFRKQEATFRKKGLHGAANNAKKQADLARSKWQQNEEVEIDEVVKIGRGGDMRTSRKLTPAERSEKKRRNTRASKPWLKPAKTPGDKYPSGDVNDNVRV